MFERLKKEEQALLGWTAKRELAKINYRIHTDAIKENLIPPELTPQQTSIVYSSDVYTRGTINYSVAIILIPPNSGKLKFAILECIKCVLEKRGEEFWNIQLRNTAKALIHFYGIATAGCFSSYDFTCIIKRETNYT